MSKRPRKRRPAVGELAKVAEDARQKADAAHSALPSPRKDNPMYAAWKRLGFADRDSEQLPRTAEEASNYVEPHERLARAIDARIAAMNAVGIGNARSGKRLDGESSKETQARRDRLIAGIKDLGEGHLLEPPYSERAIENAMILLAQKDKSMRFPTPEAFVKYLLRQNSKAKPKT
jgi:hypothetical protein